MVVSSPGADKKVLVLLKPPQKKNIYIENPDGVRQRALPPPLQVIHWLVYPTPRLEHVVVFKQHLHLVRSAGVLCGA